MMGHDYNWTHNRYFKSDLERLRLKFSGVENIERNWSQVYQDIFVLSLLDGKRNGTYLEIGGDDGKAISNTYLLETEFDWKGLAFEWLEGTENPTSGWKGYLVNRKNPCLCEDATKADYAKLLKKYKFPKQIDFLQVDIEPAQQTLDALKAIPHNNYRFSVICFETAIYMGQDMHVQQEQIDLLNSLGYELIAKNVANENNPFEDWWVDPTVVDVERVKFYKEKDFTDDRTKECTEVIFNDVI